jgi:hypothetical protein
MDICDRHQSCQRLTAFKKKMVIQCNGPGWRGIGATQSSKAEEHIYYTNFIHEFHELVKCLFLHFEFAFMIRVININYSS